MSSTKHQRLAAPALVFVGGTIIAMAIGIGHGWANAWLAEAITDFLALGYFLLAGSDSDLGAVYGNRADERQVQVVMQASHISMLFMIAIAFVGVVITVALKKEYWEFELFGNAGGFAYLLSIMFLTARDRNVNESSESRND
jgi:small basic protein